MFRTAVPSILTTRLRLLNCCNVVNTTQIKSRTYHQIPTMKVNSSVLLTISLLIASNLLGRYRGLLSWRARQHLQTHSAA
jgi:hypothetical protein